jgi:glycosyltransferase involved in cell wall biosynthesis
MRILFVTPYYFPEFKFGGPPRKIHSIARGLATLGHTVRVVTFDHANGAASERKEVDRIPVLYLQWKGIDLRQWPADRFALREEIANADIVHCYGIYNVICPVAARMTKRAGSLLVVEPLGMYPPRARSPFAKRAYNIVVTRWLMRSATAIVAASQNEAKELAAIVDSKKIVLRPNGIDVEAFASLPNGDHLRERWKFGAGDKLVLFVGRISPIKNLEQLILAFEKSNVQRSRLVLVGPTDDRAFEVRLREVISARGLHPRVIIAGPLYGDDQRAALHCADLFVLPSLSESFGNAAAEAVAAGVPVLLTETCGIAPLIHKRAGLAVPLGVDSLAQGLRIMLDPVSRDQFLVKREQVKRELSWEEPIAQTEELYARLIAERKAES